MSQFSVISLHKGGESTRKRGGDCVFFAGARKGSRDGFEVCTVEWICGHWIGGRVFELFMISVTIVPILLGVSAAKGRAGKPNPKMLRIGWILYVLLWFGSLYFLRYRWA
jgi:hypothetical protein